jgi:hypothetical protein
MKKNTLRLSMMILVYLLLFAAFSWFLYKYIVTSLSIKHAIHQDFLVG